MSKKSIVIFVLAAGVVAGALVYDGMSRRHANSGQTISQISGTPVTTAANGSANSANAQTDAQAVAPAADAGQATDDSGQNAGQNSASADAQAQAGVQNDGNADASAGPAADAAQTDAAQLIVIPAGTTLSVRLGEDLGSRISEVDQRFSATLDQDVVVGGQTVIGAGAVVRGKVVFARPAGALTGEANLQLRLTSIHVDKANLAVVTSTRSFGPNVKGKNKVGRFMKGLVKRASGNEREVLLAEQSAYSFTLRKGLQVQ